MNITGTKVAAAFVKARQGMASSVTKDGKGNFGKYTTLAAVMEAIAEQLNKNDLAIIQEATVSEQGIVVTTSVLHNSGETITFEPLPLPLAQRTAQGVGSAITYGRRYQLCSICGLAPDDDDGEAADKGTAEKRLSVNAQPAVRRMQGGEHAPEGAERGYAPRTHPEGSESVTPYAAIAAEATGKLKEFLDWCYGLHRQNGPCSDEQYRYLAGVINAITGVNASHNAILAALVRRPVSSEDVPGSHLVGKLLDTLVEHKTVDEIKIANPTYKKPYANAIKRIYELTRELDGQARLIDMPESPPAPMLSASEVSGQAGQSLAQVSPIAF